MSAPTVDLDLEAAPAPTDGDLRRVNELAHEVLALRRTIEDEEAALEERRARLRTLEESDLVEAMRAAGQEKCRVDGGYDVELVTAAHASLSEERKPAAFAWLSAHGHGAIVKQTVTARFEKGDNRVAMLTSFLAEVDGETGRPVFEGVDVDDSKSVHPSTLKAFVKEQRAAMRKAHDETGAELFPDEIFGVFERRFVTVELPKAKKGRKK